MESLVQIPGIIFDIEGVVLRGKQAISQANKCIHFLNTALKDIDRDRFIDVNDHIPFVGLTNGEGYAERQVAENISNILNLKDSEKLKADQIIANFTILRPAFEQYKEKLVMLVGVGDLELLAMDLGLKKFVTDEEYCALYPKLVPHRGRPEEGEQLEALRKRIGQRLQIIDESEFNEPLQVHAIFIINEPIKWDERIQIICDLLSTTNGRIAHKMPVIGPSEHIPVYSTNDDLVDVKTFRNPRISLGSFNETLKRVYKLVYKRDLELEIFGKSCKSTFEYIERHIKTQTNLKIGKFYMIGDNPKSDIRGGNNAGWVTILVKTGVFHQTDEHPNDPEDPATYVVEDFAAAIKLICEIEGIKCDFL